MRGFYRPGALLSPNQQGQSTEAVTPGNSSEKDLRRLPDFCPRHLPCEQPGESRRNRWLCLGDEVEQQLHPCYPTTSQLCGENSHDDDTVCNNNNNINNNNNNNSDGKRTDSLTLLLLLLLLSCAKSHMLSASRRQPHLLHVSAVDRRQTWSMDKS